MCGSREFIEMFPTKKLRVCDCNHDVTVASEKLGSHPNHSYRFVAYIGEAPTPDEIQGVQAVEAGRIVVRQKPESTQKFCVTSVLEDGTVSGVAETFYEHSIAI